LNWCQPEYTYLSVDAAISRPALQWHRNPMRV
jgi:hypothetical protein